MSICGYFLTIFKLSPIAKNKTKTTSDLSLPTWLERFLHQTHCNDELN